MSGEAVKISIVTPVLNDVRVGRALDSILAQRHDHELELVVIDAGSTDGTRDVLRTYRDRLATIVSEADDGIYDGMNKGIRRATGDVVGILNADDRYHDPLVLRDVMAAFSRDDVDACYGDMVYTDAAERVVRYWKSGAYRPFKWWFGWVPGHAAFFVRRRVYERYGAFDLRYPIAADYELMLRLILKHRIKVAYVNRVLVDNAIGGASGTISGIARGNRDIVRAWRAHRLRGGWCVPVLKLPRKLRQRIGAGRYLAADSGHPPLTVAANRPDKR